LGAGARRARQAAELHEFCLVGWYSMTVNANGDAVTCCILQDHKNAVLGSIHASSLAEIWRGPAYERFRRELREIMARRGDVDGFSHACMVEGLCAQKDACPNRSYYWSDDLDFRREFHETVEAMAAPEGEPFASLPGGNPRPSVTRSPALPVR
jgi:radical SAM protein with 4Fe4S-binding SPASM domain